MIITETDLMMDERGQPVVSAAGDSLMVSGIDCFLQDIRNEAVTTEGNVSGMRIMGGLCWILCKKPVMNWSRPGSVTG